MKETKEYVDHCQCTKKRRRTEFIKVCFMCSFFHFFQHIVRIYLNKSCKTHFNPGTFSKKLPQQLEKHTFSSPQNVKLYSLFLKNITVANLSNHCCLSMDYCSSSFTEPFLLVDLVPWTSAFLNWMSLLVDLSS